MSVLTSRGMAVHSHDNGMQSVIVAWLLAVAAPIVASVTGGLVTGIILCWHEAVSRSLTLPSTVAIMILDLIRVPLWLVVRVGTRRIASVLHTSLEGRCGQRRGEGKGQNWRIDEAPRRRHLTKV